MAINLLKSQYIDALMKIVFDETGIDLSGYREAMLSRRILQRLTALGLDPDQYILRCSKKPIECRELVNDIAINVSHFFRNPIVFEIIAQTVIPDLLSKDKDELRVWSAGCSAGEEAYSMAILIHQALKLRPDSDITPIIFATDIDENIIEKAREAIYTQESLKNAKSGIIDTYFTSESDNFELCSEIKEMLHFSIDDLLSKKTISPAESIFGSFDLILCRNILIYFSEKHQNQVIRKLYQSLEKGGYLILGDSELISRDFKSRFKTIDARNKIFQK